MHALRIAPLIVAALIVVGLFAAVPSERAAATTDISGTWNMTLIHPDIPGTIGCSATITQIGSSLSVSIACQAIGSGSLTGSISKPGGAVTLSGTIGGEAASMSGTAAMDDNSMSGTWMIAPAAHAGTFSGFRTSGAVGGIAELPATDVAPLAAREDSGMSAALVAALAAVGLAVLTTAGVAWRARQH